MSASRSCVLLTGLVAALTVVSVPAAAKPRSIDRIVAFGASLTDTGNAFEWLSRPENQMCGERSNVPPYDALEDLVPSGPYARGGHHFSNGATWVEGLARDLALAGTVRPAFRSDSARATNYAVGGARAIAGYPCRVNLPDQVAAYFADFAQTSPRALVAIEIGGNDVRDALVAAALFGQDPEPAIQDALTSLAGAITQLYAHGARHFLLLNVPDVGKTPAVLALDQAFPGIAGLANTLSQAYNGGLLSLAQALAYGPAALPGIDIRILDVYTILNNVTANASAYGFENVTEACVTPGVPPFACAKADTYAFWDGIHPTRALHAIVAEEALALITAP